MSRSYIEASLGRAENWEREDMGKFNAIKSEYCVSNYEKPKKGYRICV
jgi:hypothetical protein